MKRIVSCVRKAVEDYDMIQEGDKVAVGIDISDSKLVTKYGIYPLDAALGIGAKSERVDAVEKFLDFIYSE